MQSRAFADDMGQANLAACRSVDERWIGEQQPIAGAVVIFIGNDVGEAVPLVLRGAKRSEAKLPVGDRAGHWPADRRSLS